VAVSSQSTRCNSDLPDATWGLVMQMPTDLTARSLAKSAENFDLTSDDSDTGDALTSFYRARLAEQELR